LFLSKKVKDAASKAQKPTKAKDGKAAKIIDSYFGSELPIDLVSEGTYNRED
jgi:hypothetical protein